MIKKVISSLVCLSFVVQTTFSNIALAQVLPAPSVALLPLNQTVSPALVRGITLYPENPLKFSFLVDPGDQTLSDEDFQKESAKLIRYFLAALTTPEEDMWVNLSPTEKDRIIPESFGTTAMGQDLLGQDYILKQLTASLMNPDEKLGKEFWARIYQEVNAKYGSTDIPLDTLSKVWIIPDKAEVLVKDKTVVVVDSHLKVMMESDYLDKKIENGKEKMDKDRTTNPSSNFYLLSSILKEIIIPAIEHEVNNGRNFAPLRQIQHSAILAAWYKKNLKRSLLGESYVDQKKIDGIKSEEKDAALKVYNQYLEAFKKGAYDTIKEDYNPETQEVVTRKYISGGARIANGSVLDEKTENDSAMAGQLDKVKVNKVDFMLEYLPGDQFSVPTEDDMPSEPASAKITFKHPPEWIQFVAAYYEERGDTARLERLQQLIEVRNTTTGADDLLSKAVQSKNPAATLISQLNSDDSKAATNFSAWLKKLRNDSLEELKVYSSSAIVTSVAAVGKYGILDLFESRGGSLTMQEIVDYLEQRTDVTHINEGNIQAVLRAFASLRWLTRSQKVLERASDGTVGRDLRFTLTEEGKQVFKLAGTYQKSTEFTADPIKLADFLNGKSTDGDDKFEEIITLAMNDWNLPADVEPTFRRETIMQLNGRFLDPLQIAMPMRVYGQGILESFDANLVMDLNQVVENSRTIENKERAKRRLKKAFQLFAHEGLVTVDGDKVKLTEKGVAALGKRILSHGVKDSYAPTYDAIETLMFGDLKSIVWRDAEGRERMVHRKLNVEASGAAHEIYFEESGKHIIGMIAERIKSGAIPSLEQVKASGEKFVFYVTDTGSGNGAWLKFINETIMKETELGRLVKEHGEWFGLMMIGADYNLDSREATHETLSDANIPHLVIPADISRPQEMKEIFDGKVEKEKLSAMVESQNTILDPNNENSIWEEASSTEVQFKPDFQLNEENIRSILKDEKSFEKIWPTLQRVHSSKRFKALGIKIENGLHVNSMLTHNRPYLGVKDMEAAQNRTPLTTAVFVDSEGRPIPNRELEQNLYEYFQAWRKLAPQLLLIELGTVLEEFSRETLDSSGYLISHSVSGQLIMEMGLKVFFAIAKEAGYDVVGKVSNYPNKEGRTTVVVALMQSKDFQSEKQAKGNGRIASDAGQLGSKAELMAQEAPGGIDLNPAQTELKEQGGRIDFDNFYAPSIFFEPLNVNGFVPVILQISPLVPLPVLLGIKREEESTESLAQASGV